MLFEAFGRLKPEFDRMPAPPPATLIVSGADLPAPLQRFEARGDMASRSGPELAFPPDGARVVVEAGAPLTLRLRGGTTALVFWSCLLPGGRKAGFCANAGDSRAVISRAGGIAQRLSVDHTADVQEEVARVESVGGSCALGLLVDPKDGGLPSAWTSMSVSQCNALPSRR